MKGFLKDKEKEKFDKAPNMPEDIKELFEQRQREQAEEREAEMLAFRLAGGRTTNRRGESSNDAGANEPLRLENITLPPPVSAPDSTAPANGLAADSTAARPAATPPPPPPPTAVAPAATRPREVEAPKRKGKKGEGEP
jgi:hypothetical protein